MCIGGGADRQEAGVVEAALAAQARSEIDYWKKGGFRDLENSAILDAKKETSDNKRQIARGQSHVAAVSGVKIGQQPVVDPNTGASKQVAAGMGIAAGDALVRAANDAEMNQKKKSKGGLVEMARFGRGQQQIAQQGMSTAANFEAGNNAANLALKNSAEEFNGEMVGAIGGMAAGYGKGMMTSPSASSPMTYDNNSQLFTDNNSGMQIDIGAAPSPYEMQQAKQRRGM